MMFSGKRAKKVSGLQHARKLLLRFGFLTWTFLLVKPSAKSALGAKRTQLVQLSMFEMANIVNSMIVQNQ